MWVHMVWLGVGRCGFIWSGYVWLCVDRCCLVVVGVVWLARSMHVVRLAVCMVWLVVDTCGLA